MQACTIITHSRHPLQHAVQSCITYRRSTFFYITSGEIRAATEQLQAICDINIVSVSRRRKELTNDETASL